MRVNFPQGKKELIVSTYQMCILQLFNNKDTYSLDEIRDATEIPEDELRRHLLSLCTPKLRILIKDSKTKHINPNDVFTFNADFTSKFRKIKVPLIAAMKENGEDEDGMSGGAGGTTDVYYHSHGGSGSHSHQRNNSQYSNHVHNHYGATGYMRDPIDENHYNRKQK